MSQVDKPGIPRVRFGPIKWLSCKLRAAIEEAVSKYEGHEWKIKSEKDYSEFACHHCAIISDGSFAVFFKFSEAVDAKRQFEIELSNLQFLSHMGGVPIPLPLGIIQTENGWILLMEALEAIKRGNIQWRQIGVTLSRIHRMKSNNFGFETDGFWGPFHQDNSSLGDWTTFFRRRRLEPLLKIAIDSGNVPTKVVFQVEKLIARLPQLCGPEITPTLLHGDAQQNNFISTKDKTYVIDPAVYFGHPEMDLALIDSFQPVPEAVFDGYRDELAIDSGFAKRRDLWRVPLYLSAVALEGPIHLHKLTGAIQRYL